MRLSPGKFNRFIKKIGQSVVWRKSDACPCRDPDSGAARYDCAICQNGRLWRPGVASIVGLTGEKVLQRWAQYGQWQAGDVVLTLPSDQPVYAMAEYDRVVFCDSSVPFSIVRTMTGPQVLDLNVKSIDRVFSVDQQSGLQVLHRIPHVSPTGVLTWMSNPPPADTQYTISGRKAPEYFCFADYPQDRAHHGGAKLPR
ncbi:hypothetical protein, partial [Nevskia sp.]|uniref:hypothetical protein n=1 Tax=Nevskia sp. TaxID=1929292 RepID=UPI0025F74B1A